MFLFSFFTTQTPYIILLIGYLFYFGSYTVAKNKSQETLGINSNKEVTFQKNVKDYSTVTVTFAKPMQCKTFSLFKINKDVVFFKEELKNIFAYISLIKSQYFQISRFSRPPPFLMQA